MEDAVRIEANQEWTGPQKSKHPFVFTIELKSGRVYYLAAPTKETMLAWVEKLTSTFKYFLMSNAEDKSVARTQASSDPCQSCRMLTILLVLLLLFLLVLLPALSVFLWLSLSDFRQL